MLYSETPAAPGLFMHTEYGFLRVRVRENISRILLTYQSPDFVLFIVGRMQLLTVNALFYFCLSRDGKNIRGVTCLKLGVNERKIVFCVNMGLFTT